MDSSLIDWTLNTINAPMNKFKSPYDLLGRISKLKTLPVLPGVAMRIIQLAADPATDAEKLAAVIEQDPLLTAQILLWASSLLRSRGFMPKLSDAEVITMELVGEFMGKDQDKGIWRYFRNHWHEWFPHLGSRANFAKQSANLWDLKRRLQDHIV